MKGVSVIICCYNSGDKLPPTLEHLALQKLLPGVNYELIIVDNNCQDNTIEIATAKWASLEKPFSLTIVQQPRPGLNFARETGIRTARYEYVILCDDDNWLCENYLSKIFNLFEEMPEVALIGGVGEAVSDKPIPGWFKEVNGFGYAVGDEGRSTGYVDSVYGAGMALRKPSFLAIIKNEDTFILTDRTGKSLASGGDTEISMHIKNAGHKIYLDHSLTFQHYLGSSRLQWSYYLKLRRSFGKATAYLQLYTLLQMHPETVRKKSSIKDFLSVTKFGILHLKYILFPAYFKNARCADFVQQMSMRLTQLQESKEMAVLADRIAPEINKKSAFKNAGSV